MNVLLVDPPFHRFMGFYRFYYPLGLGYIAAVLNRSGHTAKIYDAEHSTECRSLNWLEASYEYQAYLDALRNERCPEWSQFSELLGDLRPQLVGISVLSVKVPAALRLASLCKSFDNNMVVVVGGDHATAAPQDLLASEHVDFAVRGEGEHTMRELAERLSQGGSRLDQIDGLSYKRNGSIVHNRPRELLRDLDTIPFPAIESLINAHSYRPIDLGLVMTSRGCPYSCSYCGVANLWGRQIRFRSIENVIAEIRMVKQEYGTTYFSFRDASFTLNRKRILDLCNYLIQANLNIEWECSTRCDLLDDELVAAMKKSGCVTIRVGIESGNERLLQEMKKSVKLSQIRDAARLLHRHDMYWAAYFMFGVPGETRETIEESMRLMAEIDPPFVSVARYALIPGTEMADEVKSLGRLSEQVDWALEGNQSLCKSHSKYIRHEEFQELMERVSVSVNQHNENHSGTIKGDHRIKR